MEAPCFVCGGSSVLMEAWHGGLWVPLFLAVATLERLYLLVRTHSPVTHSVQGVPRPQYKVIVCWEYWATLKGSVAESFGDLYAGGGADGRMFSIWPWCPVAAADSSLGVCLPLSCFFLTSF